MKNKRKALLLFLLKTDKDKSCDAAFSYLVKYGLSVTPEDKRDTLNVCDVFCPILKYALNTIEFTKEDAINDELIVVSICRKTEKYISKCLKKYSKEEIFETKLMLLDE